jgi:hypothetical protein
MWGYFVGDGIELIVGVVSGGSNDQNAQLAGNQWQGYVPNDFTHFRIVIDAHEPLMICPQEFLLPIEWTPAPVPTEASTWGRVKSLFR